MLPLNFTPFPIITTERLILRQLRQDDAQELFSLRTSESVNRFLDRPVPGSLNDVRTFITLVNQMTHKNEGIYWGITLKNQDKVLGTIGLRNFNREQFQAEIGYELHPDHQREGFMNEALTQVLAYGFGQLGLRAIIADTVPANMPSIKILKKQGFLKADGLDNTYLLINRKP